MRRGALLLLLVWCLAAAAAEERVEICYNYGCLTPAEIVYSPARLLEIERLLALADSDEGERALLAQAVGRLYRWAGEQSPVNKDRGGNFPDDGVDGRMDCIDHSTSTTRLLRMLERRGWLRWHRVLEPARRTRFLVMQHFSAVVETVRLEDGAARFVVDSWFVNNGEPAVVLPLASWLQGEGPNVE